MSTLKTEDRPKLKNKKGGNWTMKKVVILAVLVVLMSMLLPACSNGAEVKSLRVSNAALQNEVVAQKRELEAKDTQIIDLQNEVAGLELQNWQSVEELKAFLAADDTDHHIILRADENGVIQFKGQCEDAAFQLRDRAFNAGRWLDTETLTRQECYKYKQYLFGDVSTLGPNDGHCLNKAVIGNEVWFIEPGNDNLWFVYYVD